MFPFANAWSLYSLDQDQGFMRPGLWNNDLMPKNIEAIKGNYQHTVKPTF